MLLSASPAALVMINAAVPGFGLPPPGPATSPPPNANSILTDRSPGGRAIATVQSKARKSPPAERVLSAVRERPRTTPTATAPNFSPSVLAAAGPLTMPAVEFVAPEFGRTSIAPMGTIGGGGGSAMLLVPVNAPGGTPGDSETPATPPPAVPEPFTWMTLLTGLGLIGWRLRRDRSECHAMRATNPQG